MPAEIVWSPAAVADLDAIWEWIAVENGDATSAERTVSAIFDRVDDIADFPLATTPLDSRCRIRSAWRFVEAGGYLAFFRVGDGRVYVDRVLSGKSDYLSKLFDMDDGVSYYL